MKVTSRVPIGVTIRVNGFRVKVTLKVPIGVTIKVKGLGCGDTWMGVRSLFTDLLGVQVRRHLSVKYIRSL